MLTAEMKVIDEIQELAGYGRGKNIIWRMLLHAVPPEPIRKSMEYKRYLAILELCLIGAQDDSFSLEMRRALRSYAEIVGFFVGEYEKKHFRIPKASQSEILRFLMEQHHLTQADLKNESGGQPAASGILSGKRKLNAGQIERLSKRFKVSSEVFFPGIRESNQPAP